jgi:hypothetical protein
MPQKAAGIEMHTFGNIYDGNGNKIPEDVFFFDSDTGQVMYYPKSSAGEFYTLTTWYKPPLRFVPLDPPEDPQPTFVVNVK